MMKSLLFFACLIILSLLSSCKKDPPTLNEKLEGSWRVTTIGLSSSPNPDYVRNGIAFSNTGEKKGTVLWGAHQDMDLGGDIKDTTSGTYTLDEQASTMRIKWKNVTNPYGMTKDSTYTIGFSQDTLKLTRPEFLDLYFHVSAVRD